MIDAFYKEYPQKEFSEIYKEDPAKHSDVDNSGYINDYQQLDLDDNWWENPIIEGEGDGGFVGESDVPVGDSLWTILLLGGVYLVYRKKVPEKK
ncbi:MAG: hypothetical protein LIO93_00070 [Bacteroidales bacterium]|nr:hypothetical protein [Bacteroidales bacterium]